MAGVIELDVVDDDSIRSALDVPLGGVGIGNGNFSGAASLYYVDKTLVLLGGAVPLPGGYQWADLNLDVTTWSSQPAGGKRTS